MKVRIWVNPGEINQHEQLQIKGRRVDTYLSPYDVPVAMSGEYVPDKHCVRVQFEYPGGEEKLRDWTYSSVVLGLGENSGRLCQIDFQVPTPASEHLYKLAEVYKPVEQVRMAVASLNASTQQSGNYRAAQECFQHHINELFAPLSGMPPEGSVGSPP